MEVDGNMSKLELEAIKRKERLNTMKRKTEAISMEIAESSQEELSTKPKFRSYEPQHEKIQDFALEKAKPGNIEAIVDNQLTAMKQPIVIEEIDIANLAPRKPDWDLKRDVSKKLERLERRTQKAIAELIRERLKTNMENISQVVNVGSTFNAEQKSIEAD